MDPRSPYHLHHHHNRYPSHPQPPPPPPSSHPPHLPPHFPDNHYHPPNNLYAPHRGNLFPPQFRPPPLPPQQPPYHHPPPTPPPPQFNPPNQAHLAYNHPTHRHPNSARPLQFENDIPRRLPEFKQYIPENRPEPPRVLHDQWQGRSYSSASLDPERYWHQINDRNMSMSPFGNSRRELERNSRFIEEREIRIEQRPREEVVLSRNHENYLRRGQFGSSSNRSSRDSRIVSNPTNHNSVSRHFELNSGNLESEHDFQYDNDGVSEDQRWLRDREVVRDARGPATEMESNEIDEGNEIRVFGGKYEHYRGREPNAEHERHTGKGSREGSHEFNKTPRKQIQKKSAFFRIQKPNYRNREDERVHYSGYCDDAKSSSFRGKNQNLYSDRGSGEENRERSPVELDVSFKSNSLVAKAILTPSSCSGSASAGVSDTTLTTRNSKIRKVLIPDKDRSNSSLTKSRDDTVNLDNHVLISSNISISDKDSKCKGKVTASNNGNAGNDNSLPGFSRNNISAGNGAEGRSTKGNPLSDKGGANAVSDKTSKVVKKKKVVKKVEKPNLSSSSLQQVKKCNDILSKGDSAPVLSASTKGDQAAAMASGDIVGSQPCPNDVTWTSESNILEGLGTAILSQKADTYADSDVLCVPHIKRKRSCSPSATSSSHEETKHDGNLITGIFGNDLKATSNDDKDFGKPLNVSISSDTGSLNNKSKQFYGGGDSLPEDTTAGGSAEVLLSVGCDTDCGSLDSDKAKIDEVHENSCNAMTPFDNGSMNSNKCHSVSNIETVEIDFNQHFENKGSLLVGNGVADRLLDTSLSLESNENFHLLNYGKTSDLCANCYNDGVGNILGSDNECNSEEVNHSSHGTRDGTCELPSQNKVNMSHEHVCLGGSPNTKVSIGGSENDMLNNEENNKKVEMSKLDLSSSGVTGTCMEPVNMANPAHWVDTTLRLSFKDPSPVEFVVSDDGHGNVGSQPCVGDGVGAFHQSNSSDISEDKVSVSSDVTVGPSETSPGNKKKRKFSASQLELSGQRAFNINDGSVLTSGVEVFSNSGDVLTQLDEEVTVAGMDLLRTSDLPVSDKGVGGLVENGPAGECLNRNPLVKDVTEDVNSNGCSVLEDVSVPKLQYFCPSELKSVQIANTTPVISQGSHQNDSMNMENNKEEMVDIGAAKEQTIIDSGTTQCQIPSDYEDLDERLANTYVDNETYHVIKNDSALMSSYTSPIDDCNGASSTNFSNDHMEVIPDALSNMGSPETTPDVPVTLVSQSCIEKDYWDDKVPIRKPTTHGGSNLSAHVSCSQNATVNLVSDSTMEGEQTDTGKAGSLLSQNSNSATNVPNSKGLEVHGRKNHSSHTVSRIYPIRSSFVFPTSKNVVSSAHVSNSRTWHRTDNPSASAPPGNKAFSKTLPAHGQSSKKVTKFQSNSYIRKGNSLVRKPTPATAQTQDSSFLSSENRLNSSGTDELKKNAGSDSRIHVIEPPNVVRAGGASASFERPRTPPLASVPKVQNHTANLLSSLLAEPPYNGCAQTASDPLDFTKGTIDVPKASEDVTKISEIPVIQIGQVNNVDCQNEPSHENLVSSNVTSITYVKRRTNQLVATSNSCSLSVQNPHTASSSSSDGYYKRRKNQLIRTSLESHTKQIVSIPGGILNSEAQAGLNITPSRNFRKRQLHKVVTKICKPSKFSLVWTLRGAKLSKNDGDSLHYQKVLPCLVPWKRATYWRNFIPNPASNSNNSSLSTIGKLLLLRKRDTVYTRSKHGFSLRKSKVLSVGGSSLKWSKSIEKQAKKANEEATLAVAEAEKKKREQNSTAHIVSETKNRNRSSRGRIFRIGSVRYKMDSSRRTLHRIPDNESSDFGALQTEKDSKKSYIPRRLVIGKDEYVRIGNGNQLVRDPKKRTRILASEKVRWSLHTARSRSAKKHKYCQFFTRFGKCNKDDGKCPYIHDPSKIAVCTKFLNGLCSNSDCKLTHKVIPERMPDCSYFLQGLCTNESCPYRHVHVNPKACTCEGFLRGYCADGNECRKKHSYVCPIYEATGSCPQGSKCKLHHPKNRSKGKKSKRLQEKKSVHSRYFGSMHLSVSELGTGLSENHPVVNNNLSCDGSMSDYISLDVSDEDPEENKYPTDEQMTLTDIEPLDLESDDLDALVIPIRIMNIRGKDNLQYFTAEWEKQRTLSYGDLLYEIIG